MLYLNVYVVQRYYIGDIDDNNYYDVGMPVASVPIEYKTVLGCSALCTDCANGNYCEEDGTICTRAEPQDLTVVESKTDELKAMFAEYDTGDFGAVSGGCEVQVMLQEHFALTSWSTENAMDSN